MLVFSLDSLPECDLALSPNSCFFGCAISATLAQFTQPLELIGFAISATLAQFAQPFGLSGFLRTPEIGGVCPRFQEFARAKLLKSGVFTPDRSAAWYERCFDVQMVEMRGTVSGGVRNNITTLNRVYDYGYDAKSTPQKHY